MTVPLRATRAEINLDNLAHNLKCFRAHVAKNTALMAVVKADAYGHGAVEVAKCALGHGASRLGVAFAEEGVALRKSGISAPILVMGAPFAEQTDLYFEHNLIPTIFTGETARCFSELAAKKETAIKIHVKVDTGMGRIGIFPHTDAVFFLEYLKTLPNLEVQGIFTHFATADEKDKSFAVKQLERFNQAIDALRQKDLCPPLVHAANSAATLEIPEAWFDMVRIGISMYGHYPSEEVNKNTIPLKPLMTLKSRVSHLKEVPPGTPISYGSTYVTVKNTLVASIPLGYGDGYSRLLSNKAHVLIRGKRFPIIGRVCMDQFLVDVTAMPEIEVGDEVVLFGKQEQEEIAVEEIARILGTINYEALCAVGKRVPRLYINN